ncbi:MAG: type I restriction endonuclease [Coriobacteriales bacterium]
MKNRYSEEEAVQKPAGELLHLRLGWDLAYAYDEETLGPNSTLGRSSHSEVVLRPRLLYALVELNEWLGEDAADTAIETLLETLSTDTLLQTNEKKYEMLRDGIPVERELPDGTKQVQRAQVFDFERPELNDFLAVEELWVQGPFHKRRCDLVGFVNGIPLIFVEFKRHDKDVLRAYEDNYSDYLDTIPQLFHFNAIYKEVTKRRDAADTGDVMVQLQSIIDEHISIAEGAAKGARFDISKIDFGVLRAEFAKTKEKHLLLNDLREVIERRLDRALRENPRNVDFFKRYEEIIDDYNKEQDRAVIEETFERLMRLSRDLDKKQRSYISEGFTNPQQQAVFEMLFQETLTKAEIKKVKELAMELVDIIQARLAEMSNWTEKPETRAAVDILIRDELYQKLPESYSEEDITLYRAEVFQYFYTRAAA